MNMSKTLRAMRVFSERELTFTFAISYPDEFLFCDS